MEDLPPLDVVLECIPAANRHRLDEKLEGRRSRVRIAKSLRNWKTVAHFLPNLKNDMDGIEYDNRNPELQQIGLLDKWLERNGSWATYRKLAECLYEAGAIESLQVLCSELSENQQQTRPVTAATPHQPTPRSSTYNMHSSRPLPEPTMKNLIQLVRVSHPYFLGLHLNLEKSSLDVVQVDHPMDHSRQLVDVFDLYLTQTEEPSWLEVVAALRAMGENRLARTIIEHFGITDGDKGPAPQEEECSTQYQAVLKYKDQLARSLAGGPDQHLLNQFRIRGWLGPKVDTSAPEMIDVALSRIQSNVSNYEVFIRMMPDNGSVKAIVDAITGICPVLSATVSKKEVESTVNKLLHKEGKFYQKNMVVVITGLMEAGKTTLLHKLFGEDSPNKYKSSGTAEPPWRSLAHYTVHTVHIDGETENDRKEETKKFKLIKPEDILKLYITKLPEESMEVSEVPERQVLCNVITTTFNLLKALVTPSKPRPLARIPELDGKPEGKDASLFSLPSVEEAVDLVSKNPDKFSGELEIIYMIDTGGQPECLEMLPSLIHNANLVLLVIDITKKLNHCIKPTLHRGGKLKPLRKDKLPISNGQMIEQLAQTMVGRSCSKILVIATHKDLLCNEELEERKEKLNEFVKQVLPHDAILTPESGFIFDVGFPPKKKGHEDEKVSNKSDHEDEKVGKIRKHIRKCIEKLEPVPLPSSFVMFENEIMHYLSEKGRKINVMELNECLTIGERLNMSNNNVKAALQYFHDKNILLYFGDIASGLVFLNPKALIDVVNKIVTSSYDTIITATERDNVKAGMVTKKYLEETDLFIPGIFEVEDAIQIFKRLYIIARFSQKQSTGEEKYIMMCLLDRLQQSEVNARLEKFNQSKPLRIHFGDGAPPHWELCCSPCGSFGSTIACLVSEFHWTICICANNKDVHPECLYHDIAMLHPKEMGSKVTLVNKTKYFEAYVDPKENECGRLCEVRREIYDAAEKVMKTMKMEKLTVAEGFECNCTPKTESHSQYFKPPKKYICKYGNKETPKSVWIGKGTSWCYWFCFILLGIIGIGLAIGFGSVSPEPTKDLYMEEPTLQLLYHMTYTDSRRQKETFNFISEAQNDCDDLGIQLDINPTIIEGFEGKPSDICREILQRWINQGGEKVTWGRLLEALDRVQQLGRVAKRLREALDSNNRDEL